MPSVLSNLGTVCVSVVVAFFVVQKVCALHAAYEIRRTRIEKEAWLRAQCDGNREPLDVVELFSGEGTLHEGVPFSQVVARHNAGGQP